MQSYIDSNRSKLDESLVSLRLMKEIDDFLEINNVNQRDFASCLGYSEAYISQLMSGTKKFNTSFINKLEKKYDLEVQFKINCRKESNYFSKLSNSSVEISINIFTSILSSTDNFYSIENNYQDSLQMITDVIKLEK
jgi:plasmid maintenance system antidote protein VapI